MIKKVNTTMCYINNRLVHCECDVRKLVSEIVENTTYIDSQFNDSSSYMVDR